MNTRTINKTESVLDRLHKDAKKDMMRIGTSALKFMFRTMQPADFENVYLPISKEQGQDLRQLVIDHQCKNIVEFGTSFGISTIYLAQGAQHTNGKVVTTELLQSKANRALQNITEADVNEYVDIRIGDAMQTLSDYNEPIDFLFLDGWKDLYLPLFKMLEPNLHENCIIYADNMDMSGTENYAHYILQKETRYTTKISADKKSFLTSIL